MNIIVHPPMTKEAIDELKKNVSSAHVELIYSQLNTLPFAQTKKCELMKALSETSRKKLAPL